MKKFTHFDDNGNAVMVDVTDKQPTTRVATACGDIYVSEDVIHAITHQEVKKGDVLGVAQLAGIMGAKKTSDIIPLCHPLMIGKCQIDFEVFEKECRIHAIATVKVDGKRWSAISNTKIPVGSFVIIDAIDGVKVVVRKED